MRIFATLTLVFLSAVAALGQHVVVNLLAPTEAASPGGEVRVDLVVLNPTSAEVVYETPLTVVGRLTDEHESWPVELRGQAGGGALIAARGFSYRSFVFVMPPDATGRLVLELDYPQPARAVIDVKAPALGRTKSPKMVSAPLSTMLPGLPAGSAIQRTFANRFSPHEPVYFVYGPDAPGAKFQFSFKYRLVGDGGELGEKIPALRGLYAGFTQRSLWDIRADSSPFFDTSYMPELLFESQSVIDPGKEGGFQILGYQTGLKHESNGRDGPDSRSLNIIYFRPVFSFGRLDNWNVLLIPRVFTYFSDLSNNPDIREYRGNVELTAVVGRNDRGALSVTGRLGTGGHKGSVQADLTVPVRFDGLFNFATYFMLQYWNGYGESLIHYNQQSSTIRAGFSLVR